MTTQTQVRSTEEALSVEDTLKLALEALNTNRVMAKDSEGNYTREITPKLIVEAITAIKEALMSLCDGAQQSAERTWEGLSVFEINDLVENTEYEDYRGLVEATEAKLKAKNERKEKNNGT